VALCAMALANGLAAIYLLLEPRVLRNRTGRDDNLMMVFKDNCFAA
jgi:hypothetical protein